MVLQLFRLHHHQKENKRLKGIKKATVAVGSGDNGLRQVAIDNTN